MENCLCHTPTDLQIAPYPPGVPSLTRRFDAVRRALFAEFANTIVAGGYPIRQMAIGHPQALGNVIPEAWAIISEILAFYDVLITKDLFIGSVTDRVLLQRLADLLGYLPRPSVAASANIALLGSQVDTPTSTYGLALRASLPSPQVFEPDEIKAISWTPRTVSLAPIRKAAVTFDDSGPEIKILFEAATATPRRGSPVLFMYGYYLRATEIVRVTTSQEMDGTDYVEVAVANPGILDQALNPPFFVMGTILRYVSAMSPSQKAYPRTALLTGPAVIQSSDYPFTILNPTLAKIFMNKPGGYGPLTEAPGFGLIPTNMSTVELDGVYRNISTADLVIFQNGARYSAHRVTRTQEFLREFAVNDTEKPKIPITVLDVAPKLPDDFIVANNYSNVVIHYNMRDIGRLMQPARSELTADLLGQPLPLEGVHKSPPGKTHAGQWLLEDADGRGALVDATFNIVNDRGQATLTITGPANTPWPTALRVPVVAHPNILHVTRGETVKDEVLGNGIPSVPSQRFQLKKSPLTYLRAEGGEGGVKSTLEVRVGDVLWQERRTFYGAGPNDNVYIVRQDDDEKSTIIFGDGVRGARLPEGRRNVKATYRFGAGAEAPPYGNITQIAKGVPGLTRVRNPVQAGGGADRETAEEIRKAAPTSALLLGRCVSLTDFSARVTTTAGVRNSKVELAWDELMLAAVVKVWYVPTQANDPGLAAFIVHDLQALAEPGTLIQAEQATPIYREMRVEVVVDPAYIAEDVAKAVKDALLDPETGLLAVGNTPIGGALARSAIAAAVRTVPGVLEVDRIYFSNGEVEFKSPGEIVPSGKYYDYSSSTHILVAAKVSAEQACCDIGA